MPTSVVILSKNPYNFTHCAAAIHRHDPSLRVILVNDGIPPDYVITETSVEGVKPFVFARNANVGIRAAGEDDVILCNDDALLETPCGFSALAQAGRDHPEYGVISATTNFAGNPRQFSALHGASHRAMLRGRPVLGQRVNLLRDEPGTLAFVCILIPRRTFDTIGPLDERFIHYGWEDNDYCRRVKNAGLKLGIFDGCFVNHAVLKSSFRGHVQPDLAPGRKLYLEKWGSM